ncbi:uncharacterized protein LOC116954466 [Petromyzon marinus]|uniref:uncharacterized protein LOC116954466 n=1 Tax=Petromyzon marinus TaxID=7757 RepID=UPI003F6FB9DA
MAESEVEHFVDLCTTTAIRNASDLKLEASDSGDDDCVEVLDEVLGSSSEEEEEEDDDVSLVVVEAADNATAGKPAAEEGGSQVRWTQELSVDEVKVEAFTRSSGPVHSLKPGAEPLEFLKLFLDDAFMERIAAETNHCAAQSHAVGWKPATRATVSTFLGVLLVMGINVLPELNQYWATDDCLGNQFIQRAMSRNRFKNLMRYLRLTDDEKMPKKGEAGYDPLYRVRPLIDHLLSAFHRHFVPFRDITVDEATCRFKGTMEFSPYAEAKPTKYGIKVFMSACAASGYVHSFFVHTGADEYIMRHGMGHYTMMQLTRRLRGHRHHVYFGRFFTSARLLRDLLRRGVYACGPVRAYHRGFPLDLRDARLRKGDVHFRQSGQLVACAWGEKKRVTTLSTNSRPIMEPAQKRPGFCSDGGCPERPQPVGNFNASKDGADAAVHLRTCYSLGREGKKWWRHLIFVLVNTAVANAYTVHRLSNVPPPKLPASHLQFRLLLAKQLVAGYAEGRAAKRPRRKRDIEKVISTEHLSRHVCVKFTGRKRVCVLCSRRGCRTAKGRGVQSSYGCVICNVHLCRVGCFLQYHEMAHLPTDFVVDPAVQIVHCPAPEAARKPRRGTAARGSARSKAAKKPGGKAASKSTRGPAPPPPPPPLRRRPPPPRRRPRRSGARAVAVEESPGDESDCVVVDEYLPKRVKLESEPEDDLEDEFVEEVDQCTQVSEKEDEEERLGSAGGGDGASVGADRGSPGLTLAPADVDDSACRSAREPAEPARDSPGGDAAGGSRAGRQRQEEGAEGGRRTSPDNGTDSRKLPDLGAGAEGRGTRSDCCAPEGFTEDPARSGRGDAETPAGDAEFRTSDRDRTTGREAPAVDGKEGDRSGEEAQVPVTTESGQGEAKHLARAREGVPARDQDFKQEPVQAYAREVLTGNLHGDARAFDASVATAREAPGGLPRGPPVDTLRGVPCSLFTRVQAAPQAVATVPESGRAAGVDEALSSKYAARERAPAPAGDGDAREVPSRQYGATTEGPRPRASAQSAGRECLPIPPYEFPPRASPLRAGCDAERAARGCHVEPPQGREPARGFPRLCPPLSALPSQHPHQLPGPIESLARQPVGSGHLARHTASPQQQHGYPALGLYPFQELYRPHLPLLHHLLPPQLQQKQQRQQRHGVGGGGGGELAPPPYGLQDGPYGFHDGPYGARAPTQHGEQ